MGWYPMKKIVFCKLFIGAVCITATVLFTVGCGCNNSQTRHQKATEPETVTEQVQPTASASSYDEPEINYFDLE